MKINKNTSLSLRKLILSALVAAPLVTLPAPLWALPSIAPTNVSSNSVTTTLLPIGPSAIQISDTVANRLVLKWSEFGSGGSPINAGETVNWVLPSASSAVLNTVATGGTLVNGHLQSNGSIYILNANGITIGTTGTVAAAGLGLSTVPQSEFFFLANGTLDNTGVTAATVTGDIVVNTASAHPAPSLLTGINVGTTGNVSLAARSVDVSGTIVAGTLNIASNAAGTGVRLAQSADLVVGTKGTASSLTDPATVGTGNATIVTNGGAAALSVGANATTINGGTLSVDTTGATVNGAITQGTGAVKIGDGQDLDGTLTLKAGTGALTPAPGAITLNTLTANKDSRLLNVTVTNGGATSLKTDRDINLRASTIAGNLLVSSTSGNIRNGGDVTVTGGTISFAVGGTGTNGDNKAITFKGPGDLTIGTITTKATTGSAVTLVSTTGSVILPTLTISGNLTVTAANNISQTGPLTNTQAGTELFAPSTTRLAKFEATTGSIMLTNAGNDMTRVALRGAPGGAIVTDINQVVVGNDTSMNGNADITAPMGIQLGAAAGDTVTFNSNLTLNSNLSSVGTGTNSAIITNGGSGYTASPTFTGPGGIAGTSTLGITAIAAPTTAGSGYTGVPSVTINDAGTGGMGATATSTVTVNTLSGFNGGSGYTALPTVAFTPVPAGGVIASATPTTLTITPASLVIASPGSGYLVGDVLNVGAGTGTLTVTAVNGTGGITAGTLSAGTGYTSLGTIAPVYPVPGPGTGAAITATGSLAGLTLVTGGLGYTSRPGLTVIGGILPTGTAAKADTTLRVTGVTVTNAGTGYTAMPAISFAQAPTPANSATGAAPTGSVQSLNVVTPGALGLAVEPAAPVFVGANVTPVTATFALGGSGGVSDGSNNVVVLGLTQINTPGPVVLDGATSSGIGLNHRFGQINVTQSTPTVSSMGGVTVYESTTLNLGAITTKGDLRAYSSAGDVIDTGPVVVRNATFGAGTSVAPGNITIDATGTNIQGAISLLDDVALVTNSLPGVNADGGIVGTYLANNVSISNANNITLAPIQTTSDGGLVGTLSLATGGDITFSGRTNVAGLVTLTGNNVTAADNDNKIANLNLTAGGNVDFRGGPTLTVDATLTQALVDRTASFRSSAAMRIGTFNSNYTGLVRFESRGSNTVADTVAGIRVFGPVHFQAQAAITINRAGHSFGRVSAATSDRNANITIVESGGLNLGNITTDGTGSFTATSTTGDIIQDVNQNGIRLGNGLTGAATFNAPLGNVLLTDNSVATGQVAGTAASNVNTMARVNVTAGGNVVINNPRTGQTGATTLGNVTAGGSLTVSTLNEAGTLGADILQASGTRINSFGVTSFQTTGAADINIGNTGNRMGGVIAVTGTGNVTLTESPTLNILSVQTGGTGSLVATSETGSIIDTSFASAAYPTLWNAIGNANAPMNATFSTPRGDVNLDLAGNNFGTVGFTTSGNVSIVDSVGNTTLAASTIGGTLNVINMQAAAAPIYAYITQTGPLAVTGGVTLTTNGGGIQLSNTANMLGGVRFTAGDAGVQIAENTTMNLRAGSTSTGPVYLVTNGDFITSGAGASSITNTLTIQAQGTIIPGAGSLLVTKTFTVFSPALKDLSLLSLSGNLLNLQPINLGSGPYTPPGI